MRTFLKIWCVIFLCFLMPSKSLAGDKEIKSSRIDALKKADKGNDFQLKIGFTLPAIPANAHVTGAYFIVDQSFELDQTGNENAKGLANKGNEPVTLVAYLSDGNGSAATSDWFIPSRIGSPGTLLSTKTIKAERAKNKWEKQAMRIDVTRLLMDQIGVSEREISFIVAGTAQDDHSIKGSKVDIDLTKISGRLIVLYAEPPLRPTRQ